MKKTASTAIYYGATDPGRVRTNNEDNFIACELWGGSHILLAAIDGIGGYEGGEVAAGIAREVIIAETSAHPEADCLELLKYAVTMANNSIVDHKKADPERSHMGCVLSAAIIDLKSSRLYMVHVGDSRLYQYTAAGGLKKLSHDHSLVGYREEIGMLTEEQAMTHPQRNIIERSLGDEQHNSNDVNFLDAGIFPIFGQTQYLFCSDGLSDMLYSAEIASVLASNADARTEVTRLIDLANEAGGKDNITAVIAKVDAPALPTPAPETPGGEKSVFGEPLPPADNSDDMLATDNTPTAPRSAPVRPPRPANRSGLKRFYWLIITIAVSFIAGGTAGYFIGRSTGEASAIASIKEAEKATEDADSTVAQDNNPTDTIADPQMVGEHDADSINRNHATRAHEGTTHPQTPPIPSASSPASSQESH